jgi:hypothetical protein
MPTIDWTKENGLMIGIALYNGSIIPKPLEYILMPFYGFNNSRLAGFGKISYNIIPYNRFIRLATISLQGTQFGAPGNQNYQKLQVGLDLYFRTNKMNNPITQKLYGNYIEATNLFQIELQEKPTMNSYLQFGYQLEKASIINPFALLTSFESNQSFLKTSIELNYKLSYHGKQNGLDFRLFTGAMLINSSNIPFYALSASGRSGSEQYLYQGTFPDRFSVFPSTFLSRQMTFTEGGLVSPVNEKLGYSRWLISLSFTSTLPGKTARIPVKPFVNFLLNDKGTKTGYNSQFFYEAGVKVGFWNIFEIYFPMLVSNNIQSITGSFKDRIRFVFKLDLFDLVKMNSVKKIEIQ